jgi:hypothetical protein
MFRRVRMQRVRTDAPAKTDYRSSSGVAASRKAR